MGADLGLESQISSALPVGVACAGLMLSLSLCRLLCEQPGVDAKPLSPRAQSGECGTRPGTAQVGCSRHSGPGPLFLPGLPLVASSSLTYTLVLCLPPQGIVGNLSSGKSALVHRYLTGTYVQEESPEGE